MSVLIRGMKMPKNGERLKVRIYADGQVVVDKGTYYEEYEAVELPVHGDLIDSDAFRKAMYHDTFETDSDLQKWESGCWIRYKMFERNIESAPVVIPAERSEEWTT